MTFDDRQFIARQEHVAHDTDLASGVLERGMVTAILSGA